MIYIRFLFFVSFVFLPLHSIAAISSEADGNNWLPLAEAKNLELQQEVRKELYKVPLWRRLILQNKMAIGVIDMGASPPRYASINGETMIYAASLPKIAVLLAAIYSFEHGTLQETPENIAALKAMIASSSNTAATEMIEKIGIDEINTILQMPEFLFYDKSHGGGLWVGKPYAKNTIRIGDPLYNISHGANVDQVCRLYYRLAAGKIISPARSEQMLDILKDPLINHKFVKVLKQVAPDATLFRKSGTWKQWHADSVMVKGEKWRNYILVALVENKNGELILQKLVPTVESLFEPKRNNK